MAIQQIIYTLPDGSSLFGMGSFFGEAANFSDVDLVVVISNKYSPIYQYTRGCRTVASQVGLEMGVYFDIIVFTESEFSENPLNDMHSLFPISRT
jgi:hypothetical protein